MELKEFQHVLRQVVILPILALLLLAGFLVWQIRGSNATVHLIEESDHAVTLVTLIQGLVVDEETGLRGYQVTSDQRFLQPYLAAEASMQNAIQSLQTMPSLGPDQRVSLQKFITAHQLWHQSFAEPLIATIAAGGSTNDVVLNLQGKARMDTIRSSLRAITRNANQRRASRITLWHQQVQEMYAGLIALALAVGIFIGLFTRDRLQAVSLAFRKSLDLQHRRAEELFRSEQRLRTTLASIGDGVVTCDAEGRIQMMNLVAQELTGWKEAEGAGRPIEEVFQIVSETTRESVENPVEKVKRLNRIVGLANHSILVRKDGSEIAIDDSGAPIRNEAGALTGVVMVFRDITLERKTRTALLANEKLAVAGRLAATIAHEIHNPLDSVSNLLYLLQHEGTTEEESRQFLTLAQGELSRVTQISRAMLSLYREARAPVPVNLKDMLDDLLLLMERRFQDLGVTISADLPPNMTVEGFPAELRQVFTNLITNAAEAAGQGGSIAIRVTPRPASVDASGLKLEPGSLIEIADSGPGISPETRQHLFEPFFTTKGEHGTGLGLWVSQGIIRKHAGTLELLPQDRHTNNGPAIGTIARVFLATKPIIDPGGD